MRKSNLIEQLDQAIDRILANPNARLSGFDSEVAALAELAVQLRNLPRKKFKAQLGRNLQRRNRMATASNL